jgi:hypothetical protein
MSSRRESVGDAKGMVKMERLHLRHNASRAPCITGGRACKNCFDKRREKGARWPMDARTPVRFALRHAEPACQKRPKRGQSHEREMCEAMAALADSADRSFLLPASSPRPVDLSRRESATPRSTVLLISRTPSWPGCRFLADAHPHPLPLSLSFSPRAHPPTPLCLPPAMAVARSASS